jgi:hypothetical protein
MNYRIRLSVLVVALAGGGVSALSSACIIPDYCFFVPQNGIDWCRYVVDAKMWPTGQPELAVPIDSGVAVGCRCMNIIEEDILMTESPVDEYIALSGELAILARQECAATVPEGFEHNCMTLDGPDASMVEKPFEGQESSECYGNCSYGNPPPFKDCPDPDPYECNDQPSPGNDDEADEVGPDDTTTDEGGLPSDLPRAP